jgi:hypothetical protein
MTNISKLDLANLAQSTDDFTAYFIGNVELHHTHIRRAEHSIVCGCHDSDGSMAGSNLIAKVPATGAMLVVVVFLSIDSGFK